MLVASGTGSITTVVTDCRLNRNFNACNRTGSGPLVINNRRVAGNSNAFVNNGTGGGGGTYSFGNNMLFSNNSNFTFTGTLNLQ